MHHLSKRSKMSWNPGNVTRETGSPWWCSSKTPLKYSQCHWHILANESRSWSLAFYLQPCFPFQVHFNWHELLKHWMPLSAFLKRNGCIKYIRLQVFKIKCYKYRLNHLPFIPLRNSCSWNFILSFKNNLYLHLHLEAFTPSKAVMYLWTYLATGSSGLPPGCPQTSEGSKHPGQLSPLRLLRGVPEGSPAVRKGPGGTAPSQKRNIDAWEKQQGKRCLNLCFHDASKDCLVTCLRQSLITCLFGKAALMKRNWETNSHLQAKSLSALFCCLL